MPWEQTITAERLLDHAMPIPESGCLIWEGATTGVYGIFKIKGVKHAVHRLVWSLINGAIPENLCVCHKCDIPLCINPAHLFLGTKKENYADMKRKGRHQHGSKHHAAKLKEEDIPRIKEMLKDGHTYKEIGETFGVSNFPIQAIKNGKLWRHVK